MMSTKGLTLLCCGILQRGHWQGCFCASELPLVLGVPRAERTCLSHGMEEGFVCVTKEKGKLGFMLNLNPNHMDEHWAVPLLLKQLSKKEKCPSHNGRI